MQSHLVETLGLLEIVASERPDLLARLLTALGDSGESLVEIAKLWGVRPVELQDVASRAARQLTRLEARRSRWRHPSEIVGPPVSVTALWSLAEARRFRVPGVRARKLRALAIRLRRIAERERQRKEFDAWIATPSTPLDTAWINEFLGK